ncbi:hypothetical protein ABZS66_36210 [Dactylosporangium sp. NPDC005572]|uniref:ATP dependent DNA ligase n=1 Tax=Dactylosporangium sp. NPDC005572 TaxID=3156889 RepID=UPI0033AB59E9
MTVRGLCRWLAGLAGQGRRAGTIGSLLLALAGRDGCLRFAGGVGTGFRDVDLRYLQQLLAPAAARHRAGAPGYRASTPAARRGWSR